MSKVLQKTEFGNPILRAKTKRLSIDEVLSSKTQELIKNMYHTLEKKQYGVGIAATQVGESLAISAIDTKPTPTRPELKREKLTIINPKITETYGRKAQLWEGCISGPELYAKVPRYKQIKLRWFDEHGKSQERIFDGFMAHVIQHEVDHLNGVLFVDKVVDSKTFITFNEYKKLKAK